MTDLSTLAKKADDAKADFLRTAAEYEAALLADAQRKSALDPTAAAAYSRKQFLIDANTVDRGLAPRPLGQ